MDTGFDYLRVPRESVGDDAAVLLEWLVADGVRVEQGEPVCTVEMSKASVDLEAPRAGWLFHLCRVEDEIPVGGPVGMVADHPERPTGAERASLPDANLKVTRKAQDLIDVHGLPFEQFEGLAIVRERDVLRAIELKDPAEIVAPASGRRPVTAIQRRVAQTVAQSSTSIPHSYLSCWLPAELCEQRLRNLSDVADISASLSDLLVYSAARATEAVPKANAAWGETDIIQYLTVNVGFALNLDGGDLVVPVIKAANTLEFDQLVARIRGYQIKARRKKLAPADLVGGTLTVTSLAGTGAHQVFPIILPGQSAILAIADPVGGSAAQSYCLTLGFDHRVLNGAEAAQFLRRVGDGIIRGQSR